MINKIFGILFIILSLFIIKFVFYPELSSQKKQKVMARVIRTTPAPTFVSEDQMIAAIVAETEKITEIDFAKNKVNFIDIKSEESEELKKRIQKAFGYVFSTIKTAPYYLEAEVFRNPDSEELIIQASIFDRASNNKVTEFGVKVVSTASSKEESDHKSR